MQTTYQKPPDVADICQPQPTGYDGGNGYSKIKIGNTEIITPSYFAPIYPHQIYDVIEKCQGSLIEYVGGTRKDLISQQFLTGIPAYWRFPESCLKVGDDRRGKIKYGLQMLLGLNLG